MGREIDVALTTLRATLEEYFAGLTKPPESSVNSWCPDFRIAGDVYREMDVSQPVFHLSVDDMRRPVENSEDRMTGRTYLQTTFRGILQTPRNRPEWAGLQGGSPQLGERMARDLAASILASMRRRMLYYSGGDQTGIYRGVTPDADIDRDGIALAAGTEYWPALHTPLMPLYCRRIRSVDAAGAIGAVNPAGDDATVIQWEIAWQADVAVDSRVFPAGELYQETFTLDRLYATVSPEVDAAPEDLPDPQLLTEAQP